LSACTWPGCGHLETRTALRRAVDQPDMHASVKPAQAMVLGQAARSASK
jgi:hypothetical protein